MRAEARVGVCVERSCELFVALLAVCSDEIAAWLVDAGQDNVAKQAADTKKTGVSGGRVTVAL